MQSDSVVCDSLADAIIFAFRIEQASLLSLDRICDVLLHRNLSLRRTSGPPIPCATINRRRIGNTLSSSEFFERLGPRQSGLWGLRANNPSCLSEGVLASSLEHLLTTHGPLTFDQMVQFSDLRGADLLTYRGYLASHCNDYTEGPDGTFWFANQRRPVAMVFECIAQALAWGLGEFLDGATVEQLHWLLCLSTVQGSKPLTRRCISRELSRRTDLFASLSRARYHLRPPDTPAPVLTRIPLPRIETITAEHAATGHGHEGDAFNPVTFFRTGFPFTYQ
jgi:hypothetical protein